MTQMTCQRPPEGWWCSRAVGHDGPCAARLLPLTPEDLVTLANVPGGLNDQLRAARDHMNRTHEGEDR